MKRERIYIIPTRFGFLYGLGVVLMLVIGTLYSNNLIYILSFFLVALFVVGMVQTNGNLRGLSVEKIKPALIQEGGLGHMLVWLKSSHAENAHQLKVELRESKTKRNSIVTDKINAKTLTPVRVPVRAEQRGVKEIKKLYVSTIFPFGLFYAWRVFDVSVQYMVYPSPEGSKALPKGVILGEALAFEFGDRGDDFTEHTIYKSGQSQRHIDWKAVARGRPLLLKNFKDGDRRTYLLDFKNTHGQAETRLRQLSLWVHICYDKKMPFALKLGADEFTTNVGLTHKKQCLKALSSFSGGGDA